MKTHQLFWGILFLTLGALILVNNVTTFNLDWYFIWTLWPIILIIFGLYFFIKNSNYRWILVVLTALTIGLVIFAAFKSITGFFDADFSDGDYQVEYYEEAYSDSIKEAFLEIDAAAGTVSIKDTTDKLIHISKKGGFGNYIFHQEYSDETANVSLELTEKQMRFRRGFLKNNINIDLNTKPKWNLAFNAGATSMNLDLTPYKIEKLYFEGGASKVKVKLGDRLDYTKVRFEAGVSKINIKVPKESGCEINAHTDFTRKDFDGFNKIDKETYRTPDFDSSDRKIVIEFDANVSSVEVERY